MVSEDIDIKNELERGLGPEYISFKNTRCGNEPYIEGWAAVQMANRIFGYNGWSSKILSVELISIENHLDQKVTVTTQAHVKIILKDGTFREDIGFGTAENIKGIGKAKKQSYKSAVTDAIKRALKQFGRALGSCCNEKDYIMHIKKIKKMDTFQDMSLLIRPNSKPLLLMQSIIKKNLEYNSPLKQKKAKINVNISDTMRINQVNSNETKERKNSVDISRKVYQEENEIKNKKSLNLDIKKFDYTGLLPIDDMISSD